MRKNINYLWARTDACLRENMGGALLLLCAFFVWIMVSFTGLSQYPGEPGPYILFCGVFGLMFALAWVGKRSYFYIFLSSFWLMGFWLKVTAHLIIGYDYIEPVGAFDFSPAAWGSVLNISSLAAIALILARLFTFPASRQTIEQSYVPDWYNQYYKTVWISSIFLFIAIPGLNGYLGLHQSGLIPAHKLPFKLGAIIAWLLYTGLGFWVAMLVWWDSLSRGTRDRIFLVPVLQSAIVSISVVSRGVFIFQLIHYYVSGYFNRTRLNLGIRHLVLFSFLFVTGFYVVMVGANSQRSIYPGGAVMAIRYDFGEGGVSSAIMRSIAKMTSLTLRLAVDRWVGVEGVMAVSTWPGLGPKLFMDGWLEKSEYGKKPVFETISNSLYSRTDYPNADKFNFVSLPGIVAMLYYSGSRVVVFFLVFILAYLIIRSEDVVFNLLGNPFVLSFYSILLAGLVSQFGNLRLVLIQCFEIWAGLLFLWFLQRKLGHWICSPRCGE